MVIGTGGGEDGFFRAFEEPFPQGVVGPDIGQEFAAPIVVVFAFVQGLAVGNQGLLYLFIVKAQLFNQFVNGCEHWAGDVVYVYLITRQQQESRPAFRFVCLMIQPVIGRNEAVFTRMVRFAARPVQHAGKARAPDELWKRVAILAQVGCPFPDADPVCFVVECFALPLQVVRKGLVGRQVRIKREVQKV